MHNELLKTLEPKPNVQKLGQINLLNIVSEFWQQVATTTSKLKYRFVALWAQDLAQMQNFGISFVLELKGSYLLLRTLINYVEPVIASVTPYFPAANRLERHTQDMFGIKFNNHPDPRRWTRHLAWSENQFPLRKSFITIYPIQSFRGEVRGIQEKIDLTTNLEINKKILDPADFAAG